MSTWKRINRRRLPTTGMIVAGSWRKYRGAWEWTISSPSHGDGFPHWADDDRTHYLRLAPAPKR